MKKIKILTILLVLSFLFLVIGKTSQAATFGSTINISTRDGNYGALKDVSFIIYKQKTDIDGKRISGDKVASGNTKDAGMATVKINVDNRQPMYLAKFYIKNADIGAAYYYDLDLSNAYTYNLIARLSSLRIILKDAEGKILPSQKFNLYTQKSGIDGYIKGDLYASGLTTGNQGYYDAFLSEGTYLVELPLDGETTLLKGDLKVTKEQKTTVIYPISEMVVTIKDDKGINLPKQKFEVYSQETDASGQSTFGKKILTATTENGTKKLLLPAGTYALKFFSANNQTNFLFNQTLAESSLLIIDHSFKGLKLILKDADGNCIKGKQVDIFVQNCATCGAFIGDKVASARTDGAGEVEFSLTPGTYIVKILGTKNFDYYFYDQKISADSGQVITEYLSLIRVISRNRQGEVLKNISVTIASQKSDINKKPIPDKTITTLNTKDIGFADLYLPAGNYIAIYNKNPAANLKVERYKMTELTILETEKGFSYPVKIISLGKTPSPAKPSAAPKRKIINNFYGQKRLSSLSLEQTLARQLKEKLEQILGKGKIGVAKEDWPILVNAHIYGGYSPEEIADTIKNGPLAVHPEIPAAVWRGSVDYQKYLNNRK